jgi:hypothetical protein
LDALHYAAIIPLMRPLALLTLLMAAYGEMELAIKTGAGNITQTRAIVNLRLA